MKPSSLRIWLRISFKVTLRATRPRRRPQTLSWSPFPPATALHHRRTPAVPNWTPSLLSILSCIASSRSLLLGTGRERGTVGGLSTPREPVRPHLHARPTTCTTAVRQPARPVPCLICRTRIGEGRHVLGRDRVTENPRRTDTMTPSPRPTKTPNVAPLLRGSFLRLMPNTRPLMR